MKKRGVGGSEVWEGWGERWRLGTGRGHRTRGRSTEMNEESWSPSHLGVYASALWPLCPRRAAQSLCNFWALSLICHFRFFFSFTSLASWASWSFINFIIFLPRGVLKYQSWVRGREGDVFMALCPQ